MGTKTKYCEAGHKFIITGTMAVGETISVLVEPLPGYTFIKWSDENTDNPREIYIEECGITYYAVFSDCGDTCDKRAIHASLVTLNYYPGYTEPYEESSITCEEINAQLGIILGTNN